MENKISDINDLVLFLAATAMKPLLNDEVWYWLAHGSGLSFVLVVLSGAVTFFAFTLMQLFDDMKDHSE